MSEPLTSADATPEDGQTSETAIPFEDRFSDVSDKAAEEVQVEATTEEPTDPEESEAARKVREATEALLSQKAGEQAAPTVSPDVARMEGRIEELKDQITRMGRAQDVPEPDGGFDFSVLDSPEIRAQLAAARDSEDEGAYARALAVIAQHVVQSQGENPRVSALEKKLESLEQAGQQQQLAQQNQNVFVQGLQAAAAMGDMERELVQQFVNENELGHLRDYVLRHGNSDGYEPRTLLGRWLGSQDPVSGRPNAEFANSATMLQAGVNFLANQLRGSGHGEAASISKTGAAAPSRGGGSPVDTGGEEMTPEEAIMSGILAAAKARNKAKAFG